MELHKANITRTKCLTVMAVMLLCAINSGWMLTVNITDGYERFASEEIHDFIESEERAPFLITPLNYHLIELTAKSTGSLNQFSRRLPSMAMALLSAAAMLYFITYIIDFRTAVMATLVWSTTLAFVRFSRSALPAMTLTAMMTIAILSNYPTMNAKSKTRKRLYILVFCISIICVMLAKDISPDLNRKPIYFFFPILLIGICPWIAFFPMVLIAPFQKAWHQKRTSVLCLWIWFALGLIWTSAKRIKAPHMILPAVPSVAILIGIVLEDLIFTQKVYTKKFAALFFQYNLMVVLFGAIAAAAYASGKLPHLLPQIITLMVITLTLAATTVLLFMKNKRTAATALIFASVSLLTITTITLFSL